MSGAKESGTKESGTKESGTKDIGSVPIGTTPAPGPTATALDHVLVYLIPLFLRGTAGNEVMARHAAIQLLECYGPVTDADFLLAAEIVAFSFTTLDNLGQSMADPAMSITTRLRLRSNANALSRAADRNRKALERGKQAGAQPAKPTQTSVAQPQADQLTNPLSAIQKVRDAIVQAAPALTEAPVNQTLSRQQRRFIERKAEQARAAQEREARKLARLAPRAAAAAAAAA